MDYVDIPRLNDVPVAVRTIGVDERLVRFTCSNLVKYVFKFNELGELEYCNYRIPDREEISDIEEIPDFEKALEMANYEINHTRILARGNK